MDGYGLETLWDDPLCLWMEWLWQHGDVQNSYWGAICHHSPSRDEGRSCLPWKADQRSLPHGPLSMGRMCSVIIVWLWMSDFSGQHLTSFPFSAWFMKQYWYYRMIWYRYTRFGIAFFIYILHVVSWHTGIASKHAKHWSVTVHMY